MPFGLGGGGALGGLLGADIGSAIIRIGADYSGLRSATTQATAQLKRDLNAGMASLARGGTNANALGRELDGATRKARLLSTALKGATAGLGLGIVGGIGMSIKAAIDFESAFAGVRKTVDASEATLSNLRQQFLDMSKEIPVAASSLARIGEAAGALGVPTDSIKEFVEVVSTIGSTTDVSVDEAATALGQLSNILGMSTEDYSRFAATLVDLGNKGASTEKQIIEIARRFGGVARGFGLAAKDVLALASSVANLGMQPEIAGSTLSRFTGRLTALAGAGGQVKSMADAAGMSIAEFTKKAEKGGKTLDAVADAAGFTGKQITAALRGQAGFDSVLNTLGLTETQFRKIQKTNPAEIFQRIFGAMKDMDAGDRQLFTQTLMGPAATAGGGVGMTTMINGLADSFDKNLVPSLGYATNAWSENTAAVKEAEERYKTTASQWQLLQNRLNTVMIEFGSTFLPTVVDVTSWLSDKIPSALMAIGDLWNQYFRAPMDELLAGLHSLTSAFLEVFGIAGGGKGEQASETINSIATGVASLVSHLADLMKLMGDLLSNPVIRGLTQIGIIVGGIAIALKGLAAFRGLLTGVGRGLFGAIPGMGRFGRTAAMDPAAMEQQKAATTQMTAAEMQLNAAKMAGSQRLLPAGATATQVAAYRAGSPYTMSAALANTRANYSRIAEAGRTLAVNAKNALSNAVSTGVRVGGSALGAATRAFWPALIGDLLLTVTQQPIGDMIKKAGAKYLGAAWSRSWMEGIAGVIQTAVFGTDAFVGLPETLRLSGSDVPSHIVQRLTTMFDAVEQFKPLRDKLEEAQASGNVINQEAALADIATYVSTLAEQLSQVQQLGEATEEVFGVTGFGSEFLPDIKRTAEGVTNWRSWADLVLDTAKGMNVITETTFDRLQTELTNTPDVATFEATLRPTFDQIIDNLVLLGEVATSELVVAIQKAAEAIGVKVKGYQLQGLETDEIRVLGQMLQEGVPRFLQQYAFNRTGAQGTLAPAAAIKPEDIAKANEALGEQTTHLQEWRDAQTEAFGPEVMGMYRAWLNEYGTAIDSADTRRKRLDIIRELFPDEKITLSKKDRTKFDQLWGQALGYLGEASKAVGLDQQTDIANNMAKFLTESFGKGASLVDLAANADFRLLWDGIGDPGTDIVNRLSGSIRDTLSDALARAAAGGATPEDRRNIRNLLNQILPDEQDIPKATKGNRDERGRRTRAAVVALFAGDITAADTAGEQEAVMKSINKLLPENMRLTFPEIEKLLKSEDVEKIIANLDAVAQKAIDVGTAAGEGMPNAFIAAWMPAWAAVDAGIKGRVAATTSVIPDPITPTTDSLVQKGADMANSVKRGWYSVIGDLRVPMPGPSGQNPPAPVGNQAPNLPPSGATGFGMPEAPQMSMPQMASPEISGASGFVSNRSTSFNIANMNVLGPPDEQSVLQQMMFMDPAANGG